MRDYLPLVIILILVAGLARAEKALIILYLLVILLLVTRWLSRQAVRNVSFERTLTGRAFLEQPVPVTLTIANRSRFPLVWMQFHESLPVEMVVPGHYSQVISLGGRQTTQLSYSLRPHKRGFYQIGPAHLTSSDLLGMDRETHKEIPASTLIVYPRIVRLESLGLPSRSMFGSMREKNPIYEDPTRPFGKRGYQTGDSLRKVDWKTTAAVGTLQVKLLEATKALELAICLDLNPASYDFIHHYDQTELAIVTAASIASWAVRQKHAISLTTNGMDPFSKDAPPPPSPLKKGNSQLMAVLEILARIQSTAGEDFPSLVNRTSAGLPWGATLLLITGRLTEKLLDELIRAHRRGLTPAVINIGHYPGLLEAQRRARHFGFAVFQIQTSLDLEVHGK
jgi:uncharacterized protein (DUF58 family)